MNPYNFVPFGPAAPRQPLKTYTHEKFDVDSFSGTLTCRLRTLTQFFIAGTQERPVKNQHQELSLLREGDDPIIPGSSLKGAIRHLAEAISGSCLTLPNDRRMRSLRNDKLEYYEMGRSHVYPLPPDFSPCGMEQERIEPKKRTACPACRLFGYLSGNVLFLGNVSFGTAKLVAPARTERIILEPFGAPAPRHRPFYGTKESNFEAPRGRKFYYHRVDGARTMKERTDFNKTIEAVLPPAEFEFTVQYQNLSAADLALLIYALVLEEPMRHKMGMGKGVGLGSVHLSIVAWQQMARKERYAQLGGGMTSLSGEPLQDALKHQIAIYHREYSNWQASLAALRDILTWDEKHPRQPRYPSRDWIKDFPSVALEDIPPEAATYGRSPARAQSFSQARTPRPQQAQPPLETSKDAQALLKSIEKHQRAAEAEAQSVYKNGEVEKKATVVKKDDGSLGVILPKLKDQIFKLKTKPQFSNAAAGNKIRVRVVVDRNGNITHVEEI